MGGGSPAVKSIRRNHNFANEWVDKAECSSSPFEHADGTMNPTSMGSTACSFQLMEIISDKQDLSFVQKVLVSENQISALCNEAVPNSARVQHGKVTHLHLNALDSKLVTVVGFYGDNAILSKIFRKEKLAPKKFLDCMDANLLKPGLYACLHTEKMYLFYWDERKQLTAAATRKDMCCNFVRYLIELCEIVYICVEGKTMEESVPQTVLTGIPIRRQRKQRLQIAMRKESEDDLKLHKGFGVEIPPSCRDHLWFQLSQGLHRTAVVAGTTNPCQWVIREKDVTAPVGKLKKTLLSLFNEFSVDCSSLPDEDFFLLLEILGKQRELDEYRRAESALQKRSQGMQLTVLDSIMKSKRNELLKAFKLAFDAYLLYKNPWEESLLGITHESSKEEKSCCNVSNEAHASDSLTRALLELELQLCRIWKGHPSPDHKILFPGAIVEVSYVESMEGGTDAASTPGKIFQTEIVSIDLAAAPGPVCFRQEVVLTTIQRSADRVYSNNAETCTVYFSKSHSQGLEKEPVILDGETELVIMLPPPSNIGQHVRVKHLDDGSSGMKGWWDQISDSKPLSLYQKAVAASSFIETMNINELSDRFFDKLFKEEPIRAWSNLLPEHASASLMGFLSDGTTANRTNAEPNHCPDQMQEDAPFIHHQASANSARIYKEARQDLWRAVGALIKDEILPTLQLTVHEQLQQESEATKHHIEAEKRNLLLMMKTQKLSTSGSSARGGHTPEQQQVHLRSVEYHTKYFMRKLPFTELQMTIRYSFQKLEPETMTWRTIEMMPDKADLEKLMNGHVSTLIVVPKCVNPTDLITLDPSMEILLRVILVKSGQVLLFVESKDKLHLSIYRCPPFGMSLGARTPIKIFKRGFDLVAFDEISRFMVLYNRDDSSITAYRFDESFQTMDWTGVDIQLSKFSQSSNIVWMELVPGKRELLLVDDQNRLRTCELAAATMKPRHITLPSPFLKACVTPDSSCLIIFQAKSYSSFGQGGRIEENVPEDCGKNGDSSISFSVLVYLLNDSLTFLKCLPLDSIHVKNLEGLQAQCKYLGSQMHLVFLSFDNDKILLKSHVLESSSAQQSFQLQKVGHRPSLDPSETQHPDQPLQSSNTPALDYIFHVFDKFATSPPLCSLGREIQLHVLLNPPNPATHKWDDTTAKKKCEHHIALSMQKLKEKGKAFTKISLHVSAESLEDWRHLGGSMSGYTFSTDICASKMGEWIQKLLCLVPLQIARAENNTLKPLMNGLQIPSDANYSDAVSLASLLRFGLYDLLLANWKGNVKVISSMGKQSSGKSYLLNHLAGCLLDVAGGRCTDGVWMTVRREPDCLYVLLDFEGLGSFERSEQEDMFLSILNAAISNVTIFNKKDSHLDKETEAIFQRFQDGISLVKADEKLFKGLFYMAIKDVDAADVEDLKSEFFAKINIICSKSPENFLTTMYNGEVEIAVLPPFQQPEFQESIADIGFTLQESKASYKSGRQFMDDLKIVIAQISARDWSPVDSKRLIMRLTILWKHLEAAINMGQCFDGQCLLEFDNQEEIKDDSICIGDFVFLIKDGGLILAEAEDASNEGTGNILGPLRQIFESIVQRHGDDEKWHTMYGNFLTLLIERRRCRVLAWLQVNTQGFNGDQSDVQKLTLEANTKLAEMKSKLVLCSCKCEKCFLRCILEKGHQADHSCLGSHKCMHECSYCVQQNVAHMIILDCKDLAGHHGAHDCKQRTHTCTKPCVFFDRSSNCNENCSLLVGHDGDHHCNSRQHMCKQKCSLEHCSNACAVPFELGDHKRHECHEKFCPMQCSMEKCNRTCVTKDHFHQLKAGAEHFCSNEHPCLMKCESPGVCNVLTELLKQTRNFHGKRSVFEYEYVSEQYEDRKDCCLMIPPFHHTHTGSHAHSTNANVVHYCDNRCPACDYYCHLPTGHPGLHKTVHGNMRKMKFVSEVEEIDLLDRKYARGESGVAEMCMMHCKARGRGHTHLVPCPGNGKKGRCLEKMFDGARHLKTKCSGLDVDVPLDEMTHDAYWEYIRFVDPCDEAERKSFNLCDHFCRSDEHDYGPSSRSHCTEKLWHAPLSQANTSRMQSVGYVTNDGHHFTCNHFKYSPHNVIFVIDRSGSMSSSDIKPSMEKFVKSGHSNRLGCVYEAVLQFIKTRLQEANRQQVKDIVSVVLFESYASTPARLLESSEELVDKLLDYKASGGTCYLKPLKIAAEILEESRRKPDLDMKNPVLIFLSDGEDYGLDDPVKIIQNLKQQEPRLVVHTIMYGCDAKPDTLQRMAQAGAGTFQLSLNKIELVKSFEDLAKSLKPKLLSLCNTSPASQDPHSSLQVFFRAQNSDREA